MSAEAADGGDQGPLIFLIAGEPSGDLLGGRLMAALKSRTRGRVRFAGIGGEGMIRQGLESQFEMAELSVMGFTEILPRVPHFLKRIRETAAAIRTLRPDTVVSIDSPYFSFRVERAVAGLGIPLVHYVAPSVWAYFPGRAKKVARFLDHILALLPFEPPYFEAVGLPCTYVGHPVVEYGAEKADGARFRRRHGIAAKAPVIAMLPGSRHSEVSRLLPVFGQTLDILAAAWPGLRAVAPTVSTVAENISAAARGWPVPTVVTTDRDEKFDAFAACDVALAASGTVSVELAVCSVPHVIAYRVSAATAFVARRIRRIDYASLVNLVMDRAVVPEFIHDTCKPELLAAAVDELLKSPGAREAQRRDLAEALARMGRGEEAPSQRAAKVVLDVIAGKARRGRIDKEEKE